MHERVCTRVIPPCVGHVRRTLGGAALHDDDPVDADAGAVPSSDLAAVGSISASRARASAGVAAVMVTWPTLRWRVTSALPYQCTVAPGTYRGPAPFFILTTGLNARQKGCCTAQGFFSSSAGPVGSYAVAPSGTFLWDPRRLSHLIGPAHQLVRAPHAVRAVSFAQHVEHDGGANRQAAVAQRPA